MSDKIDYLFLSEMEGGSKTKGYIPAAALSKSGVTIATGFDLGQRNVSDLKKLGLSSKLITILTPYLGKKSNAAQDALNKAPLKITTAQAADIDKAVKKSHVELITRKYNSVAKNGKGFTDLPAEAQTVIASISYQYGTELNVRAPKFWEAAKSQDWRECIKVLNNFGDVYPARRKKEAALLEKIK